MLTGGFEKLWDWIEKMLTGQDGTNRGLASQMGQDWIPNFNEGKSPQAVANSAFQTNNNDVSNIDFSDAIKNFFTGNIDYQRQFELQQNAQSFNAQEAQKARDYNLMMSNTAYQRQVEDLQSAGLNPAVALGGSGATSGYSVSASSGVPSSPHSGASFSHLMSGLFMLLTSSLNSAVQTNNLDKRLDLLKKETQIHRDRLGLEASKFSYQKAREQRYDSYVTLAKAKELAKAREIFDRLFD